VRVPLPTKPELVIRRNWRDKLGKIDLGIKYDDVQGYGIVWKQGYWCSGQMNTNKQRRKTSVTPFTKVSNK
jgi:hypothetical protein